MRCGELETGHYPRGCREIASFSCMECHHLMFLSTLTLLVVVTDFGDPAKGRIVSSKREIAS
jgi:hypothetical protein